MSIFVYSGVRLDLHLWCNKGKWGLESEPKGVGAGEKRVRTA